MRTKVISDVANLYGVETRVVNQAIKNNPDKFPEGYVIELTNTEWKEMKSKILISLSAGGKVKPPKAFTEKGLYMLATILKSPADILGNDMKTTNTETSIELNLAVLKVKHTIKRKTD